MTTEQQNQWAQLLESASQREIRQMAEYAIDHIEDARELKSIKAYLSDHQWTLANDKAA